MNSLSNQLSKVSIKDREVLCEYTVRQTLDTSVYNIGYLTTVNMNFYQLWAMFGRDPVFVKTDGNKCKYEWRIESSDGTIFSIYDWNNDKPLLETTQWHIGSNGNKTANKRFMSHLGQALRCYSSYYTCMEKGVFQSENEEAQNCMNQLKSEIEKKLNEFAGK